VRAAALLLAVLAAGCGTQEPRATGDALRCGGARAVGERLFADDSPFNTPIPRDAAVDPASPRMVEGIVEAARKSPFVLSVERYTVAVYRPPAGTPRVDIPLTADYEDGAHVAGVPIPDEAEPDPSDDGHLAVIDASNGCEYDFWQARKDGDGWQASAGNALRIDGTGVFRCTHKGANAAGFALTAGLVFPHELAAHEIRHALFFAYPLTRAGDPVPPATHSDGASDDLRAIPEGTRIRLDPRLDLETLDLRPWERTIARALQRYGMILGDTSGTPSVFAANRLAFPDDPYRESLPAGTYVGLGRIPLGSLQVMR
jgi:hypothetical protein